MKKSVDANFALFMAARSEALTFGDLSEIGISMREHQAEHRNEICCGEDECEHECSECNAYANAWNFARLSRVYNQRYAQIAGIMRDEHDLFAAHAAAKMAVAERIEAGEL